MVPFRVGFGFDVHRLVEGRPCWLGGVLIPSSVGPDGHSDADVLIHAICDALLGALALGDIGQHFPDTDASYKGADSKELLKQVVNLVHARGYRIGNVDATLVAQKPKVMPHASAMRSVLSQLMQIGEDQVSIKATTNEGMGFIGREEGLTASAVALVYRA
jgi:2-C-methyl-D-erythritol 2,4-cyclodiphosphate synthase